MKLHYFPDTDTLYINLQDKPRTESEEIAAEVVVDFGAEGEVAGITIASHKNPSFITLGKQ